MRHVNIQGTILEIKPLTKMIGYAQSPSLIYPVAWHEGVPISEDIEHPCQRMGYPIAGSYKLSEALTCGKQQLSTKPSW